jgi:hypothetical protein
MIEQRCCLVPNSFTGIVHDPEDRGLNSFEISVNFCRNTRHYTADDTVFKPPVSERQTRKYTYCHVIECDRSFDW